MTGIERLRQMAEDFKSAKTAEHCTFIVNTWRGRYIDDAIADIADQIERERACDGDTIENLRLELGEQSEDVAWVRDHGGLDAVREKWDGRVDVDVVSRMVEGHKAKRERLKAHALGLERKCAERGETIRELNKTIADMRPRLMPEGMEWLVEVWPKWSNGEYCKFGDWWKSDKYGEPEPKQLRKLSIYTPEQLREWGQDDGDHFGYEWDFMRPSDPKYRPDKVEPPAPKVLDADGVEIREKGDVWWICEGDDRGIHAERLRVETIGPNGLIECSPYNGGTWVYLEPSELYVNKPVPAADGKPLREGETVYHVADGRACVVREVREGGAVVEPVDGRPCGRCRADYLTHERPDSYDALWEDIENCAVGYEGFMSRAKALAERDR